MDFLEISLAAIGVAFIVLASALRNRSKRARAGASTRDQSRGASSNTRFTTVSERISSSGSESDWLKPERGSDQRARSGSESPNFFRQTPPPPPSPPKPELKETTTVVMRKQVPPREGPPRSWFGGLPMMPEGVEWPRGINLEVDSETEVPLHFICQIAMADLPSHLWAGLGPREGWLLFFVNGNHCTLDEEGVTRFVHTTELGEEREPPADIGPIHDGMYTGGRRWTGENNVYPRVPVDLVSMPNQLYEYNDWKHAAPENLAQLLNEGCEIGDNGPYRGLKTPFTWRGLAEALDTLFAVMDNTHAREREDQYWQTLGEKFVEPEHFTRILNDKQAALDEAIVKLPGRTDDETENAFAQRTAHLRERIRSFETDLAETRTLIEEHPSAEKLLAHLQTRTERHWQTALRSGLEQLRAFAEQRGLDTSLTTEEWDAIKTELATGDAELWTLGWHHGRGGVRSATIQKRKKSVVGLLERHLSEAAVDTLKRYYPDPETRVLIPEDILPDYEAHMRSLDDNLPQRMGGYHDGVQSGWEGRPDGKVLLLQLSCDYVLEMIWGDCGGVYAFISPDDLERGDFNKADIHLECH